MIDFPTSLPPIGKPSCPPSLFNRTVEWTHGIARAMKATKENFFASILSLWTRTIALFSADKRDKYRLYQLFSSPEAKKEDVEKWISCATTTDVAQSFCDPNQIIDIRTYYAMMFSFCNPKLHQHSFPQRFPKFEQNPFHLPEYRSIRKALIETIDAYCTKKTLQQVNDRIELLAQFCVNLYLCEQYPTGEETQIAKQMKLVFNIRKTTEKVIHKLCAAKVFANLMDDSNKICPRDFLKKLLKKLNYKSHFIRINTINLLGLLGANPNTPKEIVVNNIVPTLLAMHKTYSANVNFALKRIWLVEKSLVRDCLMTTKNPRNAFFQVQPLLFPIQQNDLSDYFNEALAQTATKILTLDHKEKESLTEEDIKELLNEIELFDPSPEQLHLTEIFTDICWLSAFGIPIFQFNFSSGRFPLKRVLDNKERIQQATRILKKLIPHLSEERMPIRLQNCNNTRDPELRALLCKKGFLRSNI